MKAILKSSLLITLFCILTIFTINIAHATSPSCAIKQNWGFSYPNSGYSYNDCDDGVLFPALNAFKDYNVFTRTPQPEWDFVKVQNSSDKSNQEFKDVTTIKPLPSNCTPSATSPSCLRNDVSFVAYVHNSGDYLCNTVSEPSSSCPHGSTQAKNVTLRISEGLKRINEPGGAKYVSDWGTSHKLTFQLNSTNALPNDNKPLLKTVTIQASSPGRLVMRDHGNNIRRYKDPQRGDDSPTTFTSYPINLLSARSGLPLVSAPRSDNTDNSFYASDGYKQYIFGQFYYEEAPVCEALTLNKDSFVPGENVKLTADLQPELLSNMPGANIKWTVNTPSGNPVYEISPKGSLSISGDVSSSATKITAEWLDPSGKVTLPDCRKEIFPEKTPPTLACEKFSIGYYTATTQNGKENYHFTVDQNSIQPTGFTGEVKWMISQNPPILIPAELRDINETFITPAANVPIFTTVTAEWVGHTEGKDSCKDSFFFSKIPTFSPPSPTPITPPTIPVPKFTCNALDQLSVKSNDTTGKTTISYKVTPSNLVGKLKCSDPSAKIKEVKILGLASTGRTTVTIDTSKLDNLVCFIDESTEVVNGACTDSFTPTPPPTEDLFCESLTETGVKVDEEAGTTTISYLVEPTSFDKPLVCDIQPANLTVEIADHNQTRIVTVNSTEIESLDCYIDEGDNTQDACRQTYTSPKEPPVEELVCKSFDLIPTKFNDGDEPEFKITNLAPADFEGKVIWKINGRNQATQDIQDSFTPNNPLKSSDVVTVEWEDHVNGEDGCFDQATSEEEPDTPDEPEKPEVCEELKVYSTKTGRAVQINSTHRLPGALQWDSYTFETVPSKYQSDITVTPSNIALTQDRGTYYAFNGGNSARLSFDGPTPECSLELSGLRSPGPDFELIKKINNKNTNHDIVNINTPIEYTVELKEINGKLPSTAKVDFSDIIQIKDEIKGKNQEAGLNKNYGTLNLISRFNKNKLKNFWSYQGLVNWDNRNYDCSQFQLDCSVSYKNRASVTITMPGIPVRPTTPNNQTITIDSNPTYAIVMCPFVLSRGFGDVYLEEGLSSGVNVQACGARNTQSPVFTKPPAPTQEIVATGANEPSHAVCQDPTSWNNNPELQKIFNPDKLSNFSSSVCEVAINNSERWQKETINKNLINIFARLQPENNVTSTNPTLLTIGDNSALRSYKGLTLGTGSEINIEGNSARTIVVYGDLLINSNLKYTQSSKGTVAFVVIGGDIKVKPGVTHLEGIFVTIPKNSNGGSFLWQTEGNAEKVPAIEIKGSAYGNIDALFEGVTESGSLAKDRGQVTTIFDGRIIRKIPPGLQDVIKFNQFQTATQSSYFTQTAK